MTEIPSGLMPVFRLSNSFSAEAGTDSLQTAESAAAWLTRRRYLPEGARLTHAEHRRLRELREALRETLRANHDGDAAPPLEALAPFAAETPLRVRFDGPRPGLEAGGGGLQRVTGDVLAAVYDAVRDGTWQRVKICSADDCQWAFFDSSRNRSATWCSMAGCGNRAKVRAYRARKSGKGA